MPARPRLSLLIKIMIVLFWGIVVFLFIQRIHLIPELTDFESDFIPDSETWLSVFFKGQKVGHSVQSLTRDGDGYIVDQKTYLRLKLMGQVQELRTVTTARLNPVMGLKSFQFFMSAGPIRFQLLGEMSGQTLDLTMMTGGHKSQSRLALAEEPRLAAGLLPYLTRQGLKKGQRFKVPILDPATLSTRPARIVVEDTEKLRIEGETIDTFRLRLDYFDAQSYTWVDFDGKTVKEQGLLGLSLVRTSAEKAREGLTGRAELTDVVTATSAPTNLVLPEPREVRHLKARLTGLDLEGLELAGGRQILRGDVVEIRREKIDVRDEASLPIQDPAFKPYLEPENFIQSRHPKIIAQARRMAGGMRSPLEVIDRIVGWVFENIEKRPTMSVPSALDVLDTRIGDCNEHAVLAAALLRAGGVPARVVVGVLYFEDRFFYHAWLEAYWGHWMALDPLLGQIPADATHIRFLTGGLARQADMVRVIGRLAVEILEYD